LLSLTYRFPFGLVALVLNLRYPTQCKSVETATDDIPTEKLIGWKRWLRETRDVPEDSFDAIWAVCRKLSQPPSFESAMLIGPPEDSPLWHDEDEDEGKSN
jgi:hypothetical protein